MALSTQDIQQIKAAVQDGMATKADLDKFATTADFDRFATKADLDNFATKTDLDRMEARLTTAINLLQRDTFSRLDEHEVRLARLERASSAPSA